MNKKTDKADKIAFVGLFHVLFIKLQFLNIKSVKKGIIYDFSYKVYYHH